MFAVYLGSILTSVLWFQSLRSASAVAIWLCFTVLFANFAEAIAEGHGKAQAASVKKSRTTVMAHRIKSQQDTQSMDVSATELKVGDLVRVSAGEIVPVDGEIVEGVASVDESAVTGESAPVVRESGGDRSSVTGGTRVISDWLIVEVKRLPGDCFLDRMIVLVALFVCLAPKTIGALLSAIGIAGMNRLSRARVIAMSGRAVEAAGDVDVPLLDKTGTITLGNRQATRFIPAQGVKDSVHVELWR